MGDPEADVENRVLKSEQELQVASFVIIMQCLGDLLHDLYCGSNDL